MAARKTKKSQYKPQYVRAKKRKGADKAVVAQRSVVVLVVLLILAALAIGIGLGFRWVGKKLFSENPRFEIQHLEITCDGKLSEEKIREYTGLHEGMNLFALSFEEIQNELGKVPMVESVELERKLPSTLSVVVKERVPVARVLIHNYKTPRLMDRYGVVLPPRVSAKLATLPLIKGLDDEVRVGERTENRDVDCALEIIGLCESNQKLHRFVPLDSLDLKYDDYMDMRLEGGIRVRMPRYRLGPKLQELAAIIQISTEQGRRVKEVDLTLETGKAVTTYY